MLSQNLVYLCGVIVLLNLKKIKMNKDQKKQLKKALGMMEEAKAIIETVKDEETDKFDNLPENLQQTEKNQKIQEDAETLNGIYDNLETDIDSLSDIINN